MTDPRYWNELATSYDHMFGYDTRGGQEKVARKAGMLVSRGHISPESVVLEVGCGTGIFTREIAKVAKLVIAIDRSDGMLAIARARDSSLNVYYCQSYFDEFECDPVDCIVFAYSLMYMDTFNTLLKCWSLLKHGCWISTIEPNILNPIIWAKLRIPCLRKMLNISDDADGFTTERIKQELRLVGFHNVQAEPIEYVGIKPLKFIGGSLLINGQKE